VIHTELRSNVVDRKSRGSRGSGGSRRRESYIFRMQLGIKRMLRFLFHGGEFKASLLVGERFGERFSRSRPKVRTNHTPNDK